MARDVRGSPTPGGSPHQRFRVVVDGRPRGGITFTIPLDPSSAWGELDAFHVHGTVGGQPFRASLVQDERQWSVQLGPTWCRAPGFGPGDEVEVVMAPEGPRSSSMGADVAAAFAAEPGAARSFDSLPSFYRNNFARWIESAKRPETRAQRIAEAVDLAKRGKRER